MFTVLLSSQSHCLSSTGSFDECELIVIWLTTLKPQMISSRNPDSERPSLATRRTIVFKLCLLMHQVHAGRAPSYLHNCITASADITSRPRLRSTSSRRYERQRTRLKSGERSFLCSRPSLHELTDTKTFKRQLKP